MHWELQLGVLLLFSFWIGRNPSKKIIIYKLQVQHCNKLIPKSEKKKIKVKCENIASFFPSSHSFFFFFFFGSLSQWWGNYLTGGLVKCDRGGSGAATTSITAAPDSRHSHQELLFFFPSFLGSSAMAWQVKFATLIIPLVKRAELIKAANEEKRS